MAAPRATRSGKPSGSRTASLTAARTSIVRAAPIADQVERAGPRVSSRPIQRTTRNRGTEPPDIFPGWISLSSNRPTRSGTSSGTRGRLDAAALCNECQQGLCHACASHFTLMSCASCFARHNRSVALHHAGRLFLTVLVFGGVAAFFRSQPHSDRLSPLMMGAVFTCMLWGWITITEHASRRFTIVGSPGVWLFLAIIKLSVSGFVGLVAAPFGIVNGIVQIVRVLRARRAVREAETTSADQRELVAAGTPAAGI
jgi:hypothetical protein